MPTTTIFSEKDFKIKRREEKHKIEFLIIAWYFNQVNIVLREIIVSGVDPFWHFSTFIHSLSGANLKDAQLYSKAISKCLELAIAEFEKLTK